MHWRDIPWNDRIAFIGRVLFGVAFVGFGVQNVLYGDGVVGLEPIPSWFPIKQAWAYLTGSLLLTAGALVTAGAWTGLAAAVIASVLSVWLLVLQVPRLILAPQSGGAWTTTFETLALCGAAWVVVGVPASHSSTARYGRFVFALSLPVFGVLHFVYRGYVASVIPSWIPAPDAWALITGAAFIAAGLSLLSGVHARLAASLLGAMFVIWVVILHTPRALAASPSRGEWTSLTIALAMSGGAWLISAIANEAPRSTLARHVRSPIHPGSGLEPVVDSDVSGTATGDQRPRAATPARAPGDDGKLVCR
jgi:uncharacterized membrane protein YphA (DoxX/SURF4 family)